MDSFHVGNYGYTTYGTAGADHILAHYDASTDEASEAAQTSTSE